MKEHVMGAVGRVLIIALLLSGVLYAQEEVNIYTARHYDSDDALYDLFTEQTGIKVNVVDGKASELLERVLAEGDNSPADVFITADAGRLWLAQQEGIFQSVSSDVLEQAIPEQLRDPDGMWFGLTIRARVIFYNPEVIDPADISRYEDLADPQWRRTICIRSSSNIYNQSLLASIIANSSDEEAESWAEGVKKNFARKPQGGDRDQIKAVAAGECDIAVGNSYYYGNMLGGSDEAQREAAESVSLLFPNQGKDDRGTHINISGGGVLKHAPHPENAVAFLEFLASKEAQKVFAEGNFEYPVVADVDAHELLQTWGEFQRDALGVDILGANNAESVRIFDRVDWP